MLHWFLSKSANGSGSKTTLPSLIAAHSVLVEFVRKIVPVMPGFGAFAVVTGWTTPR